MNRKRSEKKRGAKTKKTTEKVNGPKERERLKVREIRATLWELYILEETPSPTWGVKNPEKFQRTPKRKDLGTEKTVAPTKNVRQGEGPQARRLRLRPGKGEAYPVAVELSLRKILKTTNKKGGDDPGELTREFKTTPQIKNLDMPGGV